MIGVFILCFAVYVAAVVVRIFFDIFGTIKNKEKDGFENDEEEEGEGGETEGEAIVDADMEREVGGGEDDAGVAGGVHTSLFGACRCGDLTAVMVMQTPLPPSPPTPPPTLI